MRSEILLRPPAAKSLTDLKHGPCQPTADTPTIGAAPPHARRPRTAHRRLADRPAQQNPAGTARPGIP